MEAFKWSQTYETGLADVDQQHHKLVDLVNELAERVEELVEGRFFVEDPLPPLFSQLTDYARYHFAEEESLMHQCGVDPRHLLRHVEAHKAFIDDVSAMIEGHKDGDPHELKDLRDYLVNWLIYHILGVDMNMARQMRLIGTGQPAAAAYEAEERESDERTEPLLKALNGLFALASARNKALQELNRSLEEKVKERTRALSEANDQLNTLAMTDGLTGLPNRRHAMGQLDTLWEEAVAMDLPLVCVMVDADNFKPVNDTYGHDAGDEVLCAVARALIHAVRSDDIVSRLGGDEFFIICPNTHLDGGMQVGEQLHRAITALSVPVGGSGVWQGSVSVGVAERTSAMKATLELVKAADEAVYAAKEAGRNCVKAMV